MQFVRHLKSPLDCAGSVVAVGNFDGLHLGHQALISELVNTSRRMGLPSIVITFSPSPRQYFQRANTSGRIMGLRDKLEMLAKLGVDWVVNVKFNHAFAALTHHAFLDHFLLAKCKMQAMIVGDDFRFGANRQGDIQYLRTQAVSKGFKVAAMPSFQVGEQRVSSTLVRSLMAAGDMEGVAAALGRPLKVCGKVNHGRKLGRSLGFPTANLRLRGVDLPKFGVYRVRVEVSGRTYDGVSNVGLRPTVDGQTQMVEIHLFNFEGDLYGKQCSCEFLHFIRAEQKFDSLAALRHQIEQDIKQAIAC